MSSYLHLEKPSEIHFFQGINSCIFAQKSHQIMIKSNFREWTLDSIERTFHLRKLRTLPCFEEWMSFQYAADAYETRFLTELQEGLLLAGESWNEVELENKFISPIIVFTKFDNELFAYFLERDLSATIGKYELSGRVDGMIASGFRNPQEPYFCLNEYKRQTDPDGDPAAQALIAMLCAQHTNEATDNCEFGIYIVGKWWHFIVLKGKEYVISVGYNAEKDEIFDIYRLLKGLKFLIEKQIRQKQKS